MTIDGGEEAGHGDNIRKGYRGLGMEGRDCHVVREEHRTRPGAVSSRSHEAVANVWRRAVACSKSHRDPGFCAIEIAQTGRSVVTGLDISESFVRIARENARHAGVAVDFRHGNASADAVSRRLVRLRRLLSGIQELQRSDRCPRRDPPRPDARRAGLDLRFEEGRVAEEIAAEVRNMHLSPLNAFVHALDVSVRAC